MIVEQEIVGLERLPRLVAYRREPGAHNGGQPAFYKNPGGGTRDRGREGKQIFTCLVLLVGIAGLATAFITPSASRAFIRRARCP